MRSIWIRAGVGALAVFGLGMMLYTAARATKAKARQALIALKSEIDSGSAIAVEHLDGSVPFVLDGRTLGRLAKLSLTPGGGNGAPSLRALVALDREHLDPVMLSSCDLVPVAPDRFDVSQGFRCATPGERGLDSFGEVRFEPVGVVRPVRAGKVAMAQLRQQGRLAIDSSHRGVFVDVKGDSGEVVRITADSNGAFMHITDGKGKVIRLQADKNGLIMKVDSQSR